MKTKEYLKETNLSGVITMASRMRRLSDLLFQQVQDLYDYRMRDFKSSWFAILATIQGEGKVDFKTLASRNNISAAAVSQSMTEIEKLKLVKVLKGKDKRSRVISLTSKGEQLLNSIIPDLLDIEATLKDLIGENSEPLIYALTKVERELKNRPLVERFEIKIVNYEDQYRKDFEKLNLAWIEESFELEEQDRKIFIDPEACIIKKGGEIFLALQDAKVVGTLALIDHDHTKLEISKLTVKTEHRCRGIAQMLINRVMEYAKKNSYEEIFALTNSKLEGAKALYEKNNFMVIEYTDKKYKRVDELYRLKI